jgi:hypothetical protein
MRMSHGFRSALRLAATVAAAAAVARAADSARRLLEELALDPPRRPMLGPPPAAVEAAPMSTVVDPLAPPLRIDTGLGLTASHDEVVRPGYHAFGPAPSVVPSRGIGFRAEPKPSPPAPAVHATYDELEASGELDGADVEPIWPREVPHRPDPSGADPPVDVPGPSPVDRLLARRHAEDLTTSPTPRARASVEDVVTDARHRGRHRRVTGAVTGTVTNVYGHGLRGLCVELIDDDQAVVAWAHTGTKGRFVVDDVPAGTYRLRAYDEVDRDFEKSWHGGARFDEAARVVVKSEGTQRNVDVVLRSKAEIDVDVTVTTRKAALVVTVTHRATGAPATGRVELSTKDFGAAIPLVDGEAAFTLTGRTSGKVRIDYLGDHQTRPASVKVRLH